MFEGVFYENNERLNLEKLHYSCPLVPKISKDKFLVFLTTTKILIEKID